ncbi:MAG: RNA 3'-terminal phosphate cyclase [Candidatus Cloacimonetes bacterium]|nr:RNA 3'-terminal phosphate cyclase [Candidatus Cloacimonadota bacterium]
MIKIDGSFGEGGGQILRSSLSLSMLTKQSFEINNIRSGRSKPGLLRQHLTAVKAATQISNAKVEGDYIGSTTLKFFPQEIVSGKYEFKIGSAGSCMLVLQTVLPVLMLQESKSEIYLEGGTHNPMAPPFDFLDKTFLPILKKMGVDVNMKLLRPGFYPAGGGQVLVEINPCKTLNSVNIDSFGEINSIKPRVLFSNLPHQVVRRELSTIRKKLNLSFDDRDCTIETNALGPGNIVELEVETDQFNQCFYGFAFKGKKAELVAQNCIDQVKDYIACKAPVGEYLCDQLIIPMMYAKGHLLCSPLSMHSKTNIEVVKKFVDAKIVVEELNEQHTLLRFL